MSTHLERAISVLMSLESQGVKFKVILPNNGGEYGNLQVAVPKQVKRKSSELRRRGDLSKFIDPLIENVQIGQTIFIPFPSHIPDLNVRRFQSVISGRCITKWGKKSAVVAIKDDDVIELMRTMPVSIEQIPLIINSTTVE